MDFIISTHTPLARRDIWEDITNAAELDFYSHAPCGARHYTNFFWHIICISTHTPHAGRDLNVSNKTVWAWDFYSHAPCGARRSSASADCISFQFLLTRPMRGATSSASFGVSFFQISTHTPHAGRDNENTYTPLAYGNFYSHAPCGARLCTGISTLSAAAFLLTRPMRGATITCLIITLCFIISTHTPLARRDGRNALRILRISVFLLTRLLRGATNIQFAKDKIHGISTHTPLARRDRLYRQSNRSSNDFYSHASCEARLCMEEEG